MKQLSVLILLFIVLTSCLQKATKAESNQLAITIETVNDIHIAAYCSPLDSCRETSYLLNQKMTQNLIDKMNKSIAKEVCDFNEDYPEYFLNIRFNDGSERDFKIIGKTMLEKTDVCFEIDARNYFENLWSVLDKKFISTK